MVDIAVTGRNRDQRDTEAAINDVEKWKLKTSRHIHSSYFYFSLENTWYAMPNPEATLVLDAHLYCFHPFSILRAKKCCKLKIIREKIKNIKRRCLLSWFDYVWSLNVTLCWQPLQFCDRICNFHFCPAKWINIRDAAVLPFSEKFTRDHFSNRLSNTDVSVTREW